MKENLENSPSYKLGWSIATIQGVQDRLESILISNELSEDVKKALMETLEYIERNAID